VTDADARGEADALGEADAGIGEAVTAEDAARDPQADTTSMNAIKSAVVGLIPMILSGPRTRSMTKRSRLIHS
jgi:hypothetical protein